MHEEHVRLAFLRDLDDAARASLMPRAKSLPRKRFVFHQGEPSDTAYIVVSGQVRITVLSAGGAEMTLDVLGPGDVFGIAGLAGVARISNAITVAPTTVLEISTEGLRALIVSHPAVFQDLLQHLLRRLTRSIQEQVATGTQRVYARVATKLLLLSEGGQLPSGLSHSEIASMIGSTRATVTRVLQDMRARGLLEVNGKQIIIREVTQLMELSEMELQGGANTVSP